MKRKVGTVSRGVRCPIIREGDDISKIVCDSVIEASKASGYDILDQDIVGLTESILARAQGNYASIDAIAKDINNKVENETLAVIFPIFSRNRFSTVLKGIAKSNKKIILMLQYPSDEVGNSLITLDQLDESGVNPYSDVLSLEEFRHHFGNSKHSFTGVDYIDLYKGIIEEAGAEAEIVFANDPRAALEYSHSILACDVHSNQRTKRILKENGAKLVLGLNDILTDSVDGSGYNKVYGLLGSNKSTEDSVKLFPRDSFSVVNAIQAEFYERTGKQVEVIVYGDGAFKDPMGEIWELADPTVAPGFTRGLEGTPSEIKLKYLADNDYQDLKGEALQKAITKQIKEKETTNVDSREAQGTTPRRIVDLVGSLCDLTSGSGDKGTPIVHIQGYFDNYSSE
ncbi:coenzyme F420-0:L-glutamate ligase [Erysipelothrix urinaevulpis]|uniref:coenzyme F420-0:L-glutamate ligase n=1 Tax=Erysipelothrix urinaevulpis TaxID=2683717 RepID=UPI001357D12D|nr:coenzyme F420-0:L-glutamate ligase [Erysipelothrix urinaevulpis]